MIRVVVFVSFVVAVAAANYTTTHFGLVPAGLGPLVLMVPFGTYFAGVTFGLRDGLQDAGGRVWVVVAIAAGAGLSFVWADGRLAVASGAAFLLAELADFAVYTPLRERGWRRAVLLSNVVGAVVDSLLFLWWAGFLDGMPVSAVAEVVGGQLLVKAVLMTAAFLLVAEGVRRVVVSRESRPGAEQGDAAAGEPSRGGTYTEAGEQVA